MKKHHTNNFLYDIHSPSATDFNEMPSYRKKKTKQKKNWIEQLGLKNKTFIGGSSLNAWRQTKEKYFRGRKMETFPRVPSSTRLLRSSPITTLSLQGIPRSPHPTKDYSQWQQSTSCLVSLPLSTFCKCSMCVILVFGDKYVIYVIYTYFLRSSFIMCTFVHQGSLNHE